SKSFTAIVRSIRGGVCSYPNTITALRSTKSDSLSLRQSPMELVLPLYGCRTFFDQCSASSPLSPNGLMSLNSIAHALGITMSHFWRLLGYGVGETFSYAERRTYSLR